MPLQLVVVGDALATVGAIVWEHARVHHLLVLLDAALFGEAHVALAALKRSLARVGTQVRFEVPLLDERLVAVGAGVCRLRTHVQVSVAPHVAQLTEALATHVALVWSLHSVHAHVLLEVFASKEAFVAHAAGQQVALVGLFVRREAEFLGGNIAAVRALEFSCLLV